MKNRKSPYLEVISSLQWHFINSGNILKINSALDAAGTIAVGQLFHLGRGNHVIIALDGMLERGGRHGKFHSPLIALTGEQCVNQTAAEAVAATHAVNDMQVILDRKSVV